MFIYGIKDKKSGEVVYIGQTTRSLSARFKQHLKASEKESPAYPIHRAIKKHGKDRYESFLIEECISLEQMDKREIELTIEFNTLVPNGYNLMLGQKGGRHSEETKKKMSVSAKAWGLGTWQRTEEDNLRNREKGLKQHEDPIQRLNFLKGNGSKEFNVYRAIQIQKKARWRAAVYERGEFVGTYLDTAAFAKEFNLNSKVITQVLRKEKKAHQGLIFEYKES